MEKRRRSAAGRSVADDDGLLRRRRFFHGKFRQCGFLTFRGILSGKRVLFFGRQRAFVGSRLNDNQRLHKRRHKALCERSENHHDEGEDDGDRIQGLYSGADDRRSGRAGNEL